jgi:hypothetical protein
MHARADATMRRMTDVRFDGMRALFVNCTLKRSPDRSHTQGLIDRSMAIMDGRGWRPS